MRMWMHRLLSRALWGLWGGLFILGACGAPQGSRGAPSATPWPAPTATFTALPPSPTAVPLAATVNGEPISLAEFQAELARWRAAAAQLGMNLAPQEGQQRVLEDLIDQVLLAQAAQEAGFNAPEAVTAYLEQLQAASPTPQALSAYWATLGFDAAGYRRWLARALAAAWMRDQIAAQVPAQAEQVHVRQILIYNEQEAQQVWEALQAGQDFDRLAARYDPQTLGDLGWFPRGYLNEPALEEAAFQLQEGEISPVIHTPLGYHILRLIERETERPLSTPARLVLQQRAVAQWLAERRQQSEIRILLPRVPQPTPTTEE